MYPTNVFAVEVAPRISDRDIIEGLANIRGDIKELRAEMNTLRAEIKANAGAIKQLREEVNNRFDDLRWMLGIFITISLVILGFVLRMQWQMQKRQTQTETTLETQKDELSFLKTLIEKLLPPKGVV
ncbi:MAG: hypothetical protein HZA13_08290 [Nitrospirae bacterium]|nr:hypothetical protein [Nitrospirota bacterium]